MVAVEPEPEFAKFLRERFSGDEGVRVIEGTIDEVDTHGFESVICFNVLEHVTDDRAALGTIARLVAPGGRLFLLVPAHPKLYGGYDRAAGTAFGAIQAGSCAFCSRKAASRSRRFVT